MGSRINIPFEVPHSIARGLDSGALERIGGVVVDAKKRTVVHWLRESSRNGAGETLLVRTARFGKALLSATDFLYLHSQFKSICSDLSQLNMKVDAQMEGKLESGLRRAADAELLSNPDSRSQELRHARDGLLEAAHSYRRLFDKMIETASCKQYERLSGLLHVVIAGELGAARTYQLDAEKSAAQEHIEAARRTASRGAFVCSQSRFRQPTGPLDGFLQGWRQGLYNADDEDAIELVEGLTRRMDPADFDKHANLKLLVTLMRDGGLEMPASVEEFVVAEEFIRGYAYEVEYGGPRSLRSSR